jgi:uncharacterized membrane protein
MNKLFTGELSRQGRIATILLASAIVAMLAVTIYLYGRPPLGSRYTDFYIISASSQAGGYPTALSTGETGIVVLTIANFEKEPASYKVMMNDFGRETVVADQLVLNDGATWQGTVEFSPVATDNDRRVEFLLYKDGSNSAYRKLQLTIGAK